MTKNVNRVLVLTVALLLVCTFGVWAGGEKESPKPSTEATAAGMPKRGGEVIIMQENTMVSMDPIVGDIYPHPVYDRLVEWRPDASGNFRAVPGLAEAWEPIDGGKKVKFMIRKGVKFHDGSDLNAEVVAWNLNRMVNNKKSYAASRLRVVDETNVATVLDEYTVVLNLKHVSGGIVSRLSETPCGVVSKKAADDNGEEWLQQNPVGTGPFKFVSWEPGNKTVLERNPNYWKMGADGKPLPYLDKVTFRIIREKTTMLNELRAGTADFMDYIPGKDIDSVRAVSHLVFKKRPAGGFKRQFFFNSKKPPFSEPGSKKLRLAIQHAIDREAIGRALGGEIGSPHPWEWVPGELGFSREVSHHNFDLDKAKQYLQEWSKETGNSLPIELEMTVHSRETDIQQVEIVQAMLAKIDIKVKPDIVERTTWGKKVKISGDFQLASRRSGSNIDMAAGTIITWAEDTYTAYHRAHVPGLMEKLSEADAEFDPDRRAALLMEAQELMHDSCWMVYMWYEQGSFCYNKRVKGIHDNLWLENFEEEWWVDE
jgi:peptide/nickel transport system substrate-binding protein